MRLWVIDSDILVAWYFIYKNQLFYLDNFCMYQDVKLQPTWPESATGEYTK